jgi:hypothetical protein
VSSDQDRVSVPTNGRRPHEVGIDPGDTRVPSPEPDRAGAPSAAEMANAASPRNLAIGFAILASVVLFVAGRVLRRRLDR